MDAPGLGAITLFTEDLVASRAFYAEVFALEQIYQDEESTAYLLGSLCVNVLHVSAAPELIEPLSVAGPGSGSRMQLTVFVPDVDAVAAEIVGRGGTILNGPIDRPWRMRTVTFADPAEHVWEFAQRLDEEG